MKRISTVLCVMALVIAVFPRVGFSNAAAPPELTPVPLKITADRNAKENRLLIPRKFLRNVGAVSLRDGGGLGAGFRTVIAGLVISVSVVCLVFLLLRKRRKAAQAMAVLFVTGAAGFWCLQQATADIAPPISEIPSVWKRVGQDQQNVTIEITEKGDAVELVLGTYYRRSLPPEERRQPDSPPDGSVPPDSSPQPE